MCVDSKVSLRAIFNRFLVPFSFSQFAGFISTSQIKYYSKTQEHTKLQITKSDPQNSYNHCQITASHLQLKWDQLHFNHYAAAKWIKSNFLLWRITQDYWKDVLVADGEVESERVFSPLTDGEDVFPSTDVEGTFELLLNTSKSIKSSLGFDVLHHQTDKQQQHNSSGALKGPKNILRSTSDYGSWAQCFFERSWVPHYRKTTFPKSEPLQSLMTSYFQNGRLIKKKHSRSYYKWALGPTISATPLFNNSWDHCLKLALWHHQGGTKIHFCYVFEIFGYTFLSVSYTHLTLLTTPYV